MPDRISSELLLRLLDDDHAAWEVLVGEYSGLLLSLAQRTFNSHGYPASRQDVEDAVADVWRNLLADDRRLIRQELEKGHLLQTLVALIRNRSIDIMRRRKFHAEALDDNAEEIARVADDAEEWPAIPLRKLATALGELTPRETACIKLFYLQRKKYREIAVLTGMPINSVGPTIVRGLAKLRRVLAVPEKTDH